MTGRYCNLKKNKLPISEIFFGLQGEGNRMGFPSIFIRTGGCNLKCEGFNCEVKSPLDGSILKGCDTIHSVNKEHFDHTWMYYNNFQDIIDDVIPLIPKKMAYNEELVDIIFTGGEPLIWYKNPILYNTVNYFVSRGHRVWFETNGTIPIDFYNFPMYNNVSMNISVKMSASGESKECRWKYEVVDNYLMNTKDSYFKFVLSKNSIEYESKEIFDFLNNVPSYGVVYCMPLGSTQKELEENAKEVYEFAAMNGFRYSDRLHIRIFDNKQGV